MTIQMLGGGAGPDNRDPVKGGKSAPGGGVAPPPGTDAVPAKHTGGGSSGRGEVPDEAEPAPGGVTDVGE